MPKPLSFTPIEERGYSTPWSQLIVAKSDWSERSQTDDARLFCVAGAIEEERGELDQGLRDGGGGSSGCGVIAYSRIRRGC